MNHHAERDLIHLFMQSVGASFPKRNFIWKFHATEYDPVGIPDIVGHIDGIFVGIEAKVEGNRPSEAQKAKLRLIGESGGVGAVLFGEKDNLVWLIPWEAAQTFSLRDRTAWLPLPFKTWTDSVGRPHQILNLAALKGLLHDARS